MLCKQGLIAEKLASWCKESSLLQMADVEKTGNMVPGMCTVIFCERRIDAWNAGNAATWHLPGADGWVELRGTQ